jgi:hypothetical protein
MIEAADLPAVLTWSQALNWMVFGRLCEGDPRDTLALERAYCEQAGEAAPKIRLTLQQGRSALLERLRSGKAVATGRKRRANGASAMKEDSLPNEIPESAWTDLRVDDASSFARLTHTSVRGEGYADVRLKREDVIAAFEDANSTLAQRAPQEDAADFRSESAVVVDLQDAIHWIAFGDVAAPNDSGSTAIWDHAVRELIHALQLAEVVAFGFWHGGGERQGIPASFWIDAELEPLKSYAFRKNQWSRENEWEQVRLFRHEIVHRWPSPLSVIQHAPTVEAFRPTEISVAETQPWWSLTAVEAWVLARDPAAVAALCRSLSAVEKGAILLSLSRHTNKPPRTARRELFDALAAAAVVAHGDLRTGNGLQPIPAVEWSRLRHLYEDGTDRSGQYRDVVIARAAVLQRWPWYDRPIPSAYAPLPSVESRTDHSKSNNTVKRKGGRSATWVKHLRKYLQIRRDQGDAIHSMSLTEIRIDFSSYATRNRILEVPKARSSLDEQIKRVRRQLVAESPELKQRDCDGEPPLSELMSTPGIRRK